MVAHRSLCGYHAVLISNGETTKERIISAKLQAVIKEGVDSGGTAGPQVRLLGHSQPRFVALFGSLSVEWLNWAQSEAAAGVVARRNQKEAREVAEEMSCVRHWGKLCKRAEQSLLPPGNLLVSEANDLASRRVEEGGAIETVENASWEGGQRRSESPHGLGGGGRSGSGRDLSQIDTGMERVGVPI